jgi:hypothetical protein
MKPARPKDAPVVSALVPEDVDFGTCDDDLLGGDGGTSGAEAMEDAVEVLKVLPDGLADARVFRDGVVAPVVRLVA